VSSPVTLSEATQSTTRALGELGDLYGFRVEKEERQAREKGTFRTRRLDFEIRVEENANERYGAFRVGSQDDLVTALGLAVQPEPVSLGIIVPRSR
jgi:hypothetical protein